MRSRHFHDAHTLTALGYRCSDDAHDSAVSPSQCSMSNSDALSAVSGCEASLTDDGASASASPFDHCRNSSRSASHRLRSASAVHSTWATVASMRPQPRRAAAMRRASVASATHTEASAASMTARRMGAPSSGRGKKSERCASKASLTVSTHSFADACSDTAASARRDHSLRWRGNRDRTPRAGTSVSFQQTGKY